MHVELSATELDNQRRFGCSVADSVVKCYSMADEARSSGDTLTVVLHDAGNAEVERVAQLSGSLIDAGCGVIQYRDVGNCEAELRVALRHARIGEERIEIQQ